ESVRIYLDGVPERLALESGYCGQAQDDRVSTTGCSAVASSTDPLTVGSYAGTAEFFDGSLDEVRLAARPLDTHDLIPLVGQGARPVGRWTFDEGTGLRAHDATERTNHGTITGGTWAVGQVGAALTLDGTTGSV